jgi:hypothetical protein
LFDRVTRKISFKGCRTPRDVNRRLMHKAKEEILVAADNPPAKFRASRRANKYKRLVPAFGVRVIDEANSRPYGRIALHLRYGHKKSQTTV